jgi:hypothetical protein
MFLWMVTDGAEEVEGDVDGFHDRKDLHRNQYTELIWRIEGLSGEPAKRNIPPLLAESPQRPAKRICQRGRWTIARADGAPARMARGASLTINVKSVSLFD